MRLDRADSGGGRSNALWGRGSRGESRSNALWGRGSHGERSNALWGRGGRRAGAVVAMLVVACALAGTAAAGTAGGHGYWGFNVQGIGHTSAYIPDSLASAILQDPRRSST